MRNMVPTMDVISAAPFGSLMQGARPYLLRLPLWCGSWQALFDYSCGLWVRSGDGCLGGWLEVVGSYEALPTELGVSHGSCD